MVIMSAAGNQSAAKAEDAARSVRARVRASMIRIIMERMRYLSIVLAMSAGAWAADPQVIYLWPDGAPGSEGKTAEESVRLANTDHVVSSVHRPSITAYLPSKPGGAAVVIMPGGGHSE